MGWQRCVSDRQSPGPITVIVFLLLSILFSTAAMAVPIDSLHAEVAVRGWLNINPTPLESPINFSVKGTTSYADDTGRVLYYLVELEPSGFAIVSADDRIEPIIAFAPAGKYDPSINTPFGALVNGDLKGRMEQLNAGPLMATVSAANPQQKWQDFISAGELNIRPMGRLNISKILVKPIILSKWSQTDEAGAPCYNYYTPENYPCGCVATAMAQLMRYHEFPTEGIGVLKFKILVDDVEKTKKTRGGDGIGGPYKWDNMPLNPDDTISSAQRQAIGALCYDAGISVNMMYSAGGSGAYMDTAKNSMVDVFGYSNAVFGAGYYGIETKNLNAMMNTNLDASLPVLLGIIGPPGGHAIVCDGYGYDNKVLYHHLNMGWAGMDDAWYNLPNIDSSAPFNVVDNCIYNIYAEGSGEIISGRATDPSGNGLAGVSITATAGGVAPLNTLTNEQGIYIFAKLPANKSFTITAEKAGFVFTTQKVSTGLSVDGGENCGNKWGVDFIAVKPAPPVANDVNVNILSGSVNPIALDATDEGTPVPPGRLSCIITSLPLHGTLSDPNTAAVITSVPYTLTGNGSAVGYTACVYFVGTDGFTYKANDSGTPPSGGDSNTAAVNINTSTSGQIDYHSNSESYSHCLLDTQFVDCRSQVIYLQSELGMAKVISDLAIKVHTLPAQTLKKWTIRMQHTNWTQYPDYTPPDPQMLATGWTVVYQSDLTISAEWWQNFHLQQPFAYNGVDNLLIDFSFNNDSASSGSGAYFCYNAGTTRVLSLKSSTGTHGDPLGWTTYSTGGTYWSSPFVPILKLDFRVSDQQPLNGDFNQDCQVEISELFYFFERWLRSDCPATNNCEGADIDKQGSVDIRDWALISQDWLKKL